MTPRKGCQVRRGRRLGTCHAVYSVSAVVQWEGEREKDVAWISDLEVVNGPQQVEHQQEQRTLVAHSAAQSSQALVSRTRRDI